MSDSPEIEQEQGFWCRQGTTDANLVYAIGDDEYHLWSRAWAGWALDVGAQIGTVGLTLARQNLGLRVICIEAVPESSDVLELNIAEFGLGARVSSVRAWAGGPGQLTGTCHYGYRGGDVESDGFVSAHRYVGNTWGGLRDPEYSIELPAVSLDGLLAAYGIDDVAVLKIDCEGCEWSFLDTPAVAKVDQIAGEYHGGFPGTLGYESNPRARLTKLLDATHRVTFWTDDPTIGLFGASRR